MYENSIFHLPFLVFLSTRLKCAFWMFSYLVCMCVHVRFLWTFFAVCLLMFFENFESRWNSCSFFLPVGYVDVLYYLHFDLLLILYLVFHFWAFFDIRFQIIFLFYLKKFMFICISISLSAKNLVILFKFFNQK